MFQYLYSISRREQCGLRRFSRFSEMTDVINVETVDRLQRHEFKFPTKTFFQIFQKLIRSILHKQNKSLKIFNPEKY